MNDYFTELSDLALKTPLTEVCGFLLVQGDSLILLQAKNVSPKPEESWLIDPEEYAQAISTRRLFGLFHSHTTTDETFSKDDLNTSEMSNLPMLIYSVKAEKYNYYRPLTAIRPYEGRPFILGVQDCGSLLEDYCAKELGIKIPFTIRTPEVIRVGLPSIPDFLGFKVVKEPPKKNDVLVFSVRGDTCQNHVGIYLGDDTILHQLMGRPSTREIYSESWKRHTKFVLRPR